MKVIVSNEKIFNSLFLDENGELAPEFSQNVVRQIADRYAKKLLDVESEQFIQSTIQLFKYYLTETEYDRKQSKWIASGYNAIIQKEMVAIVKEIVAQRLNEIEKTTLKDEIETFVNKRLDRIVQYQMERIDRYVEIQLEKITTDLIKTKVNEALKQLRNENNIS